MIRDTTTESTGELTGALSADIKLLGNLLTAALGSVTGTLNRLGGLLLGLAKGALLAWALANPGTEALLDDQAASHAIGLPPAGGEANQLRAPVTGVGVRST